MSGIFGVVSLHGEPTDMVALRALGQHVSRPFGGEHTWHVEACVAMGQVGSDAPALSPATLAVCDARLDNQQHLRTLLELEPSVDVSGLLLSAFESWRFDTPEKVRGDFALAIYDGKRNELILGVEAFATRPLYYAIAGTRIAFASTPDAFRAVSWVSLEPDGKRVADYLVPAHECDLPPSERAIWSVTFTRSGAIRWQESDTQPSRS